MLSTMKSAVIVAVCALGLTACNTTSPHHVSTSGALYLNVGDGSYYHRNRHIHPHVRYVRPPVRYVRPPVRYIRPPVHPIRPVRHHTTKYPGPHRGQNVKDHRPPRDRCKPRRGDKVC